MNHIYLDYAATTPIDTEVFEAMKPYFTEYFHNPSGVYSQAVAVQKVLADARSSVANVLSARPQEIVFFDGGTEANNQALLGSIREWKKSNPNKTPHVITTSTEHSSIIELCHHLEKTKECNVDYLDVDRRGTISIKQLKTLINENTVIVSVSYANGEVGTIQDIKEVAKTVRQYKKKEGTLYPYVHTDAAQAAQFCNMNVLQLGIDFMTITGSKIYGPKKIAALYIKNGTGIEPLLFGGDQESSLRPGTENIPYIVGLATALTKVRNVQEQEHARQLELKTFFINEIKKDDSIIIIIQDFFTGIFGY